MTNRTASHHISHLIGMTNRMTLIDRHRNCSWRPEEYPFNVKGLWQSRTSKEAGAEVVY